MAKVKSYSVTKDVVDSHGNIYKILVYGEVTAEKALDGIEVSRVRFRHGDKKVVDKGESLFYALGDNCSPSKALNFGWAICNPNDAYDEAKGIEIAKGRFSKSPITTQDCRFLKEDMVLAILNQTANYVETHEFKDALKKYEAEKNFYENFRDGEIVKIFDGDLYGALNLENQEKPTIRWAFYNHDDESQVLFDSRFTSVRYMDKNNFIKYTSKATNEEKAKIAEYLKKRYGNAWGENNVKFVKA